MKNGIYQISAKKGIQVMDGKARGVVRTVIGWTNDMPTANKSWNDLNDAQISFLSNIGLAEDQTYIEKV